MNDLDNSGIPQTSLYLWLMTAAAAVIIAGGGYLVFRGSPAKTPASAPAAPLPAPAPAAVAPPVESPAPVAKKPAARAPARAPAPAPAPEEPESAPTGGPLFRVESDVAGASVFIDRQYVGTTPLETRDVAAGHHRLNVSAQGFEGYSGDVDVAEGGAPITIRFREVRLDASVDVVHKHGMGACEGRLRADAAGLGYITTNRGDAFRITYADLEALDLDYLKKNLRLKVRGGRTYNFTDKAANADALFVFQRDVQKTRDRLANGDPPAGVR